jgi:chemotaxis protein methyltransferase WspC
MRHIEALLRRQIGLDPASVGLALIERTVRLRMKQHGIKKTETYRDLLATSHEELNELIEAVVVTETWFFRDREPFNAFKQLAQQKLKPPEPSLEAGEPETNPAYDLRSLSRNAGPVRVLSLPCASGEEPYSIAITLLEAGVPEACFTIEAADISAHALSRAERAVYGNNSFRGRDLAFRDRHFLPARDGYALSPHVRRCVKFARGNLLNDNFLDGRAPYDFIFCRNLLIYFDADTQVLALGKLHRLLAADGVLFVGPAELPLVVASGFVNAGLPMAFACQKATRNAVGEGRRTDPPRKTSDAAAKFYDLRNQQVQGRAARYSRPATRDALEVAQEHMKAGRLAEGVAICNAHLARAGPSAQAYFLLGLAAEASDDSSAMAFYRKALYLEPKHYKALVQITLVFKKTGDLEAARIYQRRAERAQPKS